MDKAHSGSDSKAMVWKRSTFEHAEMFYSPEKGKSRLSQNTRATVNKIPINTRSLCIFAEVKD